MGVPRVKECPPSPKRCVPPVAFRPGTRMPRTARESSAAAHGFTWRPRCREQTRSSRWVCDCVNHGFIAMLGAISKTFLYCLTLHPQECIDSVHALRLAKQATDLLRCDVRLELVRQQPRTDHKDHLKKCRSSLERKVFILLHPL